MTSIETQSKLSILRQKANAGTITIDELREGIQLLREDRVSAFTSSAKARSKKQVEAVDADDLLSKLDDL